MEIDFTKKSIIFLIALTLIVSLPVFASTPTQENAPAPTSEDGMFLDMTQLSEEELMGVEGNVITAESDGASPITKDSIKNIERKLKSINWRLKDWNNLLGISYEQNLDGTYTITITVIGVTSTFIISETDFLQIEIYAASHNMEIQGAILVCWIL
ncbi:MAG: hypothetical protein NUV32_10690 [Exilispira sp.]|nr:hypothetical protein [Exilispira sp.]